jgi:putative ABC transport system permease protein
MYANFIKARADLRRRKLQSAVITVVILLSSLASTLALNLLVESDAPYDHALAQANGAHLTGSFSADKVTVPLGASLAMTASPFPWWDEIDLTPQ